MVGRRYLPAFAGPIFRVEHVSFRECICTDFVEYDGVLNGFYRCVCEQWSRSLLFEGLKIYCTVPLSIMSQWFTRNSTSFGTWRTVDGRYLAPVARLPGSLSHYLQDFIHARWLFGISSINSSKGILMNIQVKVRFPRFVFHEKFARKKRTFWCDNVSWIKPTCSQTGNVKVSKCSVWTFF